MKTRAFLMLFPLALLPLPAVAQGGGPPPQARQGLHAVVGSDDLAALDYFLAMSDAELDRLMAAIARVRAMSPDERAAFRQRMLEYRALPDEQRNVIRRGWGWSAPADRADWQTMMRSKSETERAAVQTELQSLAPEERTNRRMELLIEWRKARRSPTP